MNQIRLWLILSDECRENGPGQRKDIIRLNFDNHRTIAHGPDYMFPITPACAAKFKQLSKQLLDPPSRYSEC